ncbi:MAG: hypothetical protein CXR31_04535 [Geobacter sp.]|nr:MAG: hypothetical protein CXR31_04535 [Geobacter sp.]
MNRVYDYDEMRAVCYKIDALEMAMYGLIPFSTGISQSAVEGMVCILRDIKKAVEPENRDVKA